MPENIDRLIANLIRADVRALQAYHVPPATGMVKLDAMENPYRWSDTLLTQWSELLRTLEVNRYPDPQAMQVKECLREVLAITDNEILLGNGSDEIIQLLAMAVAAPGRVVMAPEPTFVMYRMIARFTQMDFVGVPLLSDFKLDLPRMLSSIEQHQPALIFLALPNNPTGNLFELAEIESIIQASSGLVVIDEAYMAFTDRHHLSLLASYANVVVMRTVSKIGLAGLRLGYLVGAPQWLHEFDKLRLPYNINILSQASAIFALQNFQEIQHQTDAIRSDREKLFSALKELPFETVWPSEANFLLVKTAKGEAKVLWEALKAYGVLIKCLHGSHALLEDCLRITVGTPAENERLLDGLNALMT